MKVSSSRQSALGAESAIGGWADGARAYPRYALAVCAFMLVPLTAMAQAIDLSKGGSVDVTARDGMEWRQNEQVVIANGDARAVRGDVTVTADRLIAHYRRKGGQAPVPAAKPGATPAADTGNNEIYRLEAVGNVHIYTATDLAVGDRAIYDIDQALLLMTGRAMRITTPQQVMTARDSLEYYSQKHMAVGRGLAQVTTADGRRLAGDTLVGFTTPPDAPGTPKVQTVKATKPGADPLQSSGKLQRVEAFGHVEVRTATETFRGDRAVYVADSQIARLAGHVHITRGLNQLHGDEALVNMKTGIYTVANTPGRQVQGLVVPNDPANKANDTKAGGPKSKAAKP